MKTLPAPVHEFLRALELELKKDSGVAPEEALCDAREYLLSELEHLQRQQPEMGYQDLMEHFVAKFGSPAQVATEYAAAADKSLEIPGYAPGWRLCCTTCGRSKPANRAGVIRIGAASRHKYVLGYCSNCRWIKWIRLVKDLDRTNLTEQLGVDHSAADLRSAHRPWLTVFAILFTVGTILAVVFGIQALSMWLVFR